MCRLLNLIKLHTAGRDKAQVLQQRVRYKSFMFDFFGFNKIMQTFSMVTVMTFMAFALRSASLEEPIRSCFWISQSLTV